MFGKNKKEAAPAADPPDEASSAAADKPQKKNTDKPKKHSQSSIKAAFLLSAIVVVLLGLVGLAAIYISDTQTASKNSQRSSKALQNLLIAQLNDTLTARIELARQLANDEAAKQLLAAADEAGLQQLADSYAAVLPDVLKLRYVKPGFLQTDQDEKAPVSYASIDLVRRAGDNNRMPPLEMHSLSSPARHIALALPVIDKNQQMLGVMHMALTPFALDDVVQRIEAGLGSLRIQQVVGDSRIDLFTSSGFDANAESQTITMSNTIWSLSFQAAAPPVSSLQQWGLLAMLAAVVLMAGFIALQMFLQMRKFRHDQENLLDILRRRLQGDRKSAANPFKLGELQQLWQAIDQLDFSAVKKGGVFKGKKITRSASKAAAPAAEQPVPEENAVKKSEPEVMTEPEDDMEKKTFPSRVTQASGEIEATESHYDVDESIFRAYDIRGIVGQSLKIEDAYAIGRGLGTLCVQQGSEHIVLGRDGRISSEALADMLKRGLRDSGIEVIDLGLIPTPLMYFATHRLNCDAGVVVTASHNPTEYNGFKIVLNGKSFYGDELKQLSAVIKTGEFAKGAGGERALDIRADYLKRVQNDIALLSHPSIVIDCGNAAGSVMAGELFEALGCQVTRLFCEIDGTFPNHHPDPGNPDNLKALVDAVKTQGADLGIAFDGDGDRLGVVDSEGNVINADRVLMLLAGDVLTRNPGADIIYDVKCSKAMASHILSSGGNPVMASPGHALMKARLAELKAPLAGEFSGHIFFAERWYGFDDAFYAAARLLEILSGEGVSSAEVFRRLPNSFSTPELALTVEEGMQHELVEAIRNQAETLFAEAKLIDIDGLRAEFAHGWGLVRASNTTPSLVFRFEADDETAMSNIQQMFRSAIAMVLPDAALPF